MMFALLGQADHPGLCRIVGEVQDIEGTADGMGHIHRRQIYADVGLSLVRAAVDRVADDGEVEGPLTRSLLLLVDACPVRLMASVSET